MQKLKRLKKRVQKEESLTIDWGEDTQLFKRGKVWGKKDMSLWEEKVQLWLQQQMFLWNFS